MALSKAEVRDLLTENENIFHVRTIGSNTVAANLSTSEHGLFGDLVSHGWAVDELMFDDKHDYVRAYFMPISEME